MSVNLSLFHFAHPSCLWLLGAVPLLGLVYLFFYRTHTPKAQLEKFIDPHLLPHLLVNHSEKEGSFWKEFLLWSLVWTCLTLALAGPRWSFREMEVFTKDQSLVVLLDLSDSMNAKDVKPSRLVRAKQSVEDLLNFSQGVKMGLVAFAADPHMITPITEDKETIRYLLPLLGTDLVYVQGSRLSSALEMASKMLEAEPGNNKAILVISDGGFEDASAITTAKALGGKGIVVHAMGVGTQEGVPLQDHEGNVLKHNGIPLLSKLEQEKLNEISKAGHGYYLETHDSKNDPTVVLDELQKRAEAQMELGKKNRFWEERFYVLLLPALPFVLWWFRRGALFALFFLFWVPTVSLEAVSFSDYFKNSEQQGQEAMEREDYEGAASLFQDPYRKGVAYYRAGHFVEAEEMFRQSSREEVASHAAYNLGTTLADQEKIQEAIDVYEALLKQWPDHIKAQENLALLKKMLKDQEKNRNQEKGDSDKENQDGKEENQESQQNDPDHESAKNSGDSEKEQESQKENDSADSEASQDQESQNQPDRNEKPETQDDSQEGQGDPEDAKDKEEAESPPPKVSQREAKPSKSQDDLDADLWLNRMTSDPKMFLKNKFYIESKKNGTKEGVNPW